MEKEQFAAFVRKTRADLGLTQINFANRLGVSWMTVFRWEKMVMCPKHDAIGYWKNKIRELKE